MNERPTAIELLAAVPRLTALRPRDLRLLRSHGTVVDRRPGQTVGPSTPGDGQIVLLLQGVLTAGPRGPIAATPVTVFVVSALERRALGNSAPHVLAPLLDAALALDRFAVETRAPGAPRPTRAPVPTVGVAV